MGLWGVESVLHGLMGFRECSGWGVESVVDGVIGCRGCSGWGYGVFCYLKN